MLTTTEIAPSVLLAPFVRCYTLREFDTKGSNMIKPWYASNEITMPFFFKAKPLKLNNPITCQVLYGGSYGGVVGLGTQYNGEMSFNGCYSFFEICFRANGFKKIFSLPSSEVTNFVINIEDIFDSKIERFYEDLSAANGLTEMAYVTDKFLLSFLKKQRFFDYKDAITETANLILKQPCLSNIKKLAYDANMSIRSFERHFTEDVGISPKLFCCITRFNYALKLKLKNPEKDWTSVAFECGYFDQMHLIKEFKKFAGDSPASFLKSTPLLRKELYGQG